MNKDFRIFVNRGKGSHRMLALGDKHAPFDCHDQGTEIKKCYLRDIIRFFDLPEDIFD